jgi:thiol-disulfide isomerase/thioredoxin
MYRIILPVLLALLLVPPAGAGGDITPPTGIRIYNIGPAPDFELADMDGNRDTLSSGRGRWVFLHFWASWCGPCRKEMPAIQRMARLMENEALKIQLVNTAEDEDTVFSFLAGVAPDMTTLMDRDGQVTEVWKPRGLPATYLIDPQGQIRYQALGGREWDQPEYLGFLNALIRSATNSKH